MNVGADRLHVRAGVLLDLSGHSAKATVLSWLANGLKSEDRPLLRDPAKPGQRLHWNTAQMQCHGPWRACARFLSSILTGLFSPHNVRSTRWAEGSSLDIATWARVTTLKSIDKTVKDVSDGDSPSSPCGTSSLSSSSVSSASSTRPIQTASAGAEIADEFPASLDTSCGRSHATRRGRQTVDGGLDAMAVCKLCLHRMKMESVKFPDDDGPEWPAPAEAPNG